MQELVKVDAEVELDLRSASNGSSRSRFGALERDDSRPAVLGYHRKTFEFIRHSILEEVEWKELNDLLSLWQRAAEDSNGVYCNTLPILSCLAVGGTVEQAIPLSASWSLYYLAARMMDDLQDQDKDDMPWSQWPVQKAMPIALGALFAAQSCLAYIEGEPQTVSEIQRNWSESYLLASRGQAIIQNDELSTYIERTTATTGLMFGAACWGGARLATSNTSILQTMQEFGIAIGMAIQIGNDFIDLSRDLQHGHLTFAPLLALKSSEKPHYQRLRSLLYGDLQPTSDEIDEVMEILQSTGMLTFSLEVAQTYLVKALTLLSRPVVASGDAEHLRTYTHSLMSQHDS